MSEDLFTPEFYRDLVSTQAQTNANLEILADRLADAVEGLSRLEPTLSSHEKRIAGIERNLRTTKRILKWAASVSAPCVGAALTYRKQIVDTLSHLLKL